MKGDPAIVEKFLGRAVDNTITQLPEEPTVLINDGTPVNAENLVLFAHRVLRELDKARDIITAVTMELERLKGGAQRIVKESKKQRIIDNMLKKGPRHVSQ